MPTAVQTLTKTKVSDKVALGVVVSVVAVGAIWAASSLLPATLPSLPQCTDYPDDQADPSLVGYYRLDCRAADDSSELNHGATHGDLFKALVGTKGTAATFDGSTTWIDAPTNNWKTNNKISQLTVAGWFYFDGDIGSARLISQEDSTGSTLANPSKNWSFRLVTLDGGAFGFNDGLLVQVKDSTVLSPTTPGGRVAVVQANGALADHKNKWVHIAATFNGDALTSSSASACQRHTATSTSPCNGLKLYINGAPIAHNLPDEVTGANYIGGFPSVTSLYNSTAKLGLGADSVGYYKFRGKMDEVKIYKRFMDAAQVKELYDFYFTSYQPSLSLEPVSTTTVPFNAGSSNVTIKINGDVNALTPLTASVTPVGACPSFTLPQTSYSLSSASTAVTISYAENYLNPVRSCTYNIAVTKPDGTHIVNSPQQTTIIQEDSWSTTINGNRYRIVPSFIATQMVDGTGNIPLNVTIDQQTPSSYDFRTEGTGSGTGIPSGAIVGGVSGSASNDRVIQASFNDAVLDANGASPKQYTGYWPIFITQSGITRQLRLSFSLTVNPRTNYCTTTSADGVTYTLDPCSISKTMTDGRGNEYSYFNIVTANSSFDSSIHMLIDEGVGFPANSVFAGSFGTSTVEVLFQDLWLSPNSQPYIGYYPLTILHGPAYLHLPELRFGINLTVNSSSPTTTGALRLTSDPSIISQTVIAGATNHTFSQLQLSATSSPIDIRVSQIKTTLKTSLVSPSTLSNIRISAGTTVLATSNDLSGVTAPGTTELIFNFANPIMVEKGSTRLLNIKADISTSAQNTGYYQVGPGITLGSGVATAQGVNGEPVTVTANHTDGPRMIVGQTGRLSISQDSSTPRAGLIPANASGVDLAVFNATAQGGGENVRLEHIALTGEAVNNGGWDQIKSLSLYRGSTFVTQVTPTSTDGPNRVVFFDLTNNPITVPNTGSIQLRFVADTADWHPQVGSTASAGQGIKLKINSPSDIRAKGESSGGTIPYASITLNNAVGYEQYLFRSLPAINQQALSGNISAGTNMIDLYQFSVTATTTGSIGLNNASFYFNYSPDVAVYNVGLYKNNVLVTATISPASGAEAFLIFNQVETVMPGSLSQYVLKASVGCLSSCITSTTAFLQVSMLGDYRFFYRLPTTISDLQMDNHFVWTDFSLDSNDPKSFSQWSNGYLIPTGLGGKMLTTSTPSIFTKNF